MSDHSTSDKDEEAPDLKPSGQTRLRDVPFRMLVPSMITTGAICSGLTGIRFAIENRFELAIIAVVFAAVLDALDGRVARLLKSATSFGEQLDSLADFLNFGVAPAIILYMWALEDLHSFGWIAALFYAICGCLRLARFNVMLDEPNKPDWHVDFFTGVPAPAAALCVLMPVYAGVLGWKPEQISEVVIALFTVGMGVLMVSSLPTWSGKRLGKRISATLVLPVILGILLLTVLLFSYPWSFLLIVSTSYLATLPFSALDWKRRMRSG